MTRCTTILICLTTIAPPALAGEISVGRPFPKLGLPLAGAYGGHERGELLSIEEFRGEKLLLHIYASW